jgi:hypothetical protein
VTDEQRKAYEKAMSELTEKDKALLESTDRFYRLQFRNVGGLVMPVIVLLTLEDGSTREVRLPAEIWRVDSNVCDTLVITEQPVVKFELDPYREIADVNRDNNTFPVTLEPSRFQLFKAQRRGGEDNPMARAKRAEEAKAKEAQKGSDESKAVGKSGEANAPVAEEKPADKSSAEKASAEKASQKPKDKSEKKKKKNKRVQLTTAS